MDECRLDAASQFLSPNELEQIRQALKAADEEENENGYQFFATYPTSVESRTSLDGNFAALSHANPEQNQTYTVETATSPRLGSYAGISEAEAAAIEQALIEADAHEEAKSIELALRIQDEQERWEKQHLHRVASARSAMQGNVRTMTRAELRAEEEASLGAYMSSVPCEFDTHETDDHGTTPSRVAGKNNGDPDLAAGFRMNSATRHLWSRVGQNSIVGPNSEVRTKHDAALDSQANINGLGLEGEGYCVGNRTFNSFRQSMNRRTKKGVETQGTGRAGSDSDGTKSGALDAASFDQIARAINAGWINKLNGIMKEGKEAVVYHADRGTISGGMDVAVKVFKRIQKFRNRGEYVDGDFRFDATSFNNSSKRQQLALWTEKEFRNLTRANRAGVPVPTPLMFKENLLLMRFMGLNGWPAPQLREVNWRKGSKSWKTLYDQVLGAVRSLYVGAKLVHGDLSEYNIMVVPAHLVENIDVAIENPQLDFQAVLIDFGQAVTARHPAADGLLQRDLDRVNSFFSRQGLDTKTPTDALRFVTEQIENELN